MMEMLLVIINKKAFIVIAKLCFFLLLSGKNVSSFCWPPQSSSSRNIRCHCGQKALKLRTKIFLGGRYNNNDGNHVPGVCETNFHHYHQNFKKNRYCLPSHTTTTTTAAATKTSTSLFGLLPSSTGYFGSIDVEAVAGASISATAKLLATIFFGVVATKKVNLLDDEAISALSRLSYWIFLPAFLFCSVATTLSTAAVGASSSSMIGSTTARSIGGAFPQILLLLMSLAAIVQLGLSYLLGKGVTKIAGLKGDESRDALISITFQNSALPIVFADALFRGSLLSDVTACISFYLLTWMSLFYGVGQRILGTNDGNDNKSMSSSFLSTVKSNIQSFLSPPFLGSIAGLIVGGIAFLRNSFLDGFATPVFGALQTLGSGYLPSALLVLAGSLATTAKTKTKTSFTDILDEENSNKRDSTASTSSLTTSKNTNVVGPLPKRTIAIVMLARFLFAPIVALGMVNLLDAFRLPLASIGAGRASRSYAVFTFVLLMEGCMPPAQSSVLLYSLAGLPERASRIAKTLAIMYAIAIIPVTILMSGCLAYSNVVSFR